MAGLTKKYADATDPELLRANSFVRDFSSRRLGIQYNGIRVFYRRHADAELLPHDPPLPLIVLVHGLGGSVAQFEPLLASLIKRASCLAIDFPGCGRSQFSPTSWDAYTTDALTDLLETAIDAYAEPEQGVIFIGHSMGTAIAARMANSSAKNALSRNVKALVGICPVSGPPPDAKAQKFRQLLYVPDFLFNLFRAWDRLGGPESPSVKRYVGPDATPELIKLQTEFNYQSRTPVFRRMAWGALPTLSEGQATGGLFGEPTWDGLNVPVCLIGGNDDVVTEPEEVEKIRQILNPEDEIALFDGSILSQANALPHGTEDASPSTPPAAAAPIGPTNKGKGVAITPKHRKDLAHKEPLTIIPEQPHEGSSATGDQQEPDVDDAVYIPELELSSSSDSGELRVEDSSTASGQQKSAKGKGKEPAAPLPDIPEQPTAPVKVIRTHYLKAGHALLYDPRQVRTVAGYIGEFMEQRVTGRLSRTWQEQYLIRTGKREGKWDVKNLQKWMGVQAVSHPIGGIFRAMKTLREVDERHCPSEFARQWGTEIKDVIDISHTKPVYNYHNFGEDHGRIVYHKLATESKKPPTDGNIASFIQLVDELREKQMKRRAKEDFWGPKPVIGVHCHYGFNRTGYLIVCYLVERCNYKLSDAIDEFAEERPTGIHHIDFIDSLNVRYSSVGVSSF
ncbi:Uu.00g005230.m01.CDS01 [Anthostomella pinea]|uniref:Uu.00g005230.m01.CDS01 n=1 Tax=Anthostomella pinea TaxID=933095 RepID=A0AAI8YJ06_9PEZI|nr:Uu.00g005230.m01.CDS01 [Anthostomella pinea]